jgi:hypothetical protein
VIRFSLYIVSLSIIHSTTYQLPTFTFTEHTSVANTNQGQQSIFGALFHEDQTPENSGKTTESSPAAATRKTLSTTTSHLIKRIQQSNDKKKRSAASTAGSTPTSQASSADTPSSTRLASHWAPPRGNHLDMVGKLTPSMNGNQDFTWPRSLVSQAGPSHWDVCSC